MVSGTSLKSYFQFDEPSGNILNKASRVNGNSTLGSAADLTATNVTYSQTGIIRSAVKTLTASNGNFVSGSSVSQYDFIHQSSKQSSIAFWIKTTATIGGLFGTQSGAASGNGFGVQISSSGSLECWISNAGAFPLDRITGSLNISSGNWHFYVITLDTNGGTLQYNLYEDGVQKETNFAISSYTNSTDADYALRMAIRANNSTLPLNADALWDEVSIWNRVLSSSEVTALYNGGAGLDLTILQISDALTLVESVTKMISKSISDSISLSGEKVNKSINKTISDTLGLTDSVRVVPSTIRLSDNILTTDTVSISKGIIRSVVDNLSAGDIISKSLGKQINDSPSLSDVLSKNINKILTDNLSLVDIVSKSITKLIVENPSFLDSTGQSKTLVKQITDALSLLESVVVAKQVTRQIIDNLSSGDSISKNIGKLLQDNPILAEQLSKAIGKIITDNISIPDSVTKNIGSLLLNQTRRINLNNTTQQMISEGKPRNVTI